MSPTPPNLRPATATSPPRQRRLAILRKAADADGSENAHFTLLSIEARASGDWRRAAALRHQTIRIATNWNARGLVIQQQTHLAHALHHLGDRPALKKLIAQMLPEVDRLGLHGIAHELRALLAA